MRRFFTETSELGLPDFARAEFGRAQFLTETTNLGRWAAHAGAFYLPVVTEAQPVEIAPDYVTEAPQSPTDGLSLDFLHQCHEHSHVAAAPLGHGDGPPLYAPIPDGADILQTVDIDVSTTGAGDVAMTSLSAGMFFVDLPDLPDDAGGFSFINIYNADGDRIAYGNLSQGDGVAVEIPADGQYRIQLGGLPNTETATTYTVNFHDVAIPERLYEHLFPGNETTHTRWNGFGLEEGLETVVYWAFSENDTQSLYAFGASAETFVAFTDAQKVMTRAVFDLVASQTGVSFIEIEAGNADLAPNIYVSGNFVMNAGGYANYARTTGGTGHMVMKIDEDGDYTEGQFAMDSLRYVVTHELGHALGLKHPFDQGGPSGPLNDTTLEPLYESQFFSVMSYTFTTPLVQEFRPLDLEALRFLYGDAGSEVLYEFDADALLMTITGTEGNDAFSGSSANDIIRAGAGDDFISAGAGNDMVYGGAGNDQIAGYGTGEYFGEAGDDSFLVNGSPQSGVTYNGGDGSDWIVSISQFSTNMDISNDQFISIENLRGGVGADRMTGNDGDNILDGGAGDDVFTLSLGMDTIIGGDGLDTIQFQVTESGTSLEIDLRNDTISIADGSMTTLSSIEGVRLFGVRSNDTIWGNDDDNFINGGGGTDVINALGGDDVINYANGNMTIDGGDGIDLFSIRNWGINEWDMSTTERFGFTFEMTNIEGLEGGFNSETLTGNAENNVLVGLGGDDMLMGLGGDDVFYGYVRNAGDIAFGSSSDNDTLDGGEGTDIAAYLGNRADYVVIDNADGTYSVSIEVLEYNTVLRAGGGDLLISVEQVQFDDLGPTAVDTLVTVNTVRGSADGDAMLAGSQDGRDMLYGLAGDDIVMGEVGLSLSLESLEGQLFRAYQAVFDRNPDASGFQAFITEMRLGNQTQEGVITEFVGSTEFQNTYGELSNEGFMRQLYLNVLDREGDAAGITAFTAALDGGRERSSVVAEFANSGEFLQLMTLPGAAFATNVIIHPVEAQVYRIYQAVFNREPDLGGFNNFVNAVQSGTRTVAQITAEFVGSAEFQGRYGALENADFVELLFTNVLPGNTDADGRASFTAALNAGTLTRADMVTEFVGSFEFTQTMTAPASAFVSNNFANRADIIHAGAGNDVLYGGRGADVFVFNALESGENVVLDFQTGIDRIFITDSNQFNWAGPILDVTTQDGNDALITINDTTTIRLVNVNRDALGFSDFNAGRYLDANTADTNISDGGSAAELYQPSAEELLASFDLNELVRWYQYEGVEIA